METCYWHLIEKRFCYDESIALYEEPPEKDEKNNNMFDNMAFYDSVAIIAGRAIVTIDPLPEKPKEEPIVQQPRRIRWWEGDDDDDERNMPSKENHIPQITQEKSNSASVSCETLLDSRNLLNLSVDSVTSKDSPEEKPKREQRSPSISKLGRAQTLAVIDDEIKMRKKSLRERRMSRSQTFNFNTSSELPLIRQLSMPKFYLETPEADQIESAIVKTPSTALSPVQPHIRFNFDLRSVVQMEKEKDYSKSQTQVPVHGEIERSSRLAQIRGKLNPLKIKRQPSVNAGPNAIIHM